MQRANSRNGFVTRCAVSDFTVRPIGEIKIASLKISMD